MSGRSKWKTQTRDFPLTVLTGGFQNQGADSPLSSVPARARHHCDAPIAPVRPARWFRVPQLDSSVRPVRVAFNQDFHFGPGVVKGYTRATPNTTSTLHITSAGRRQGSSVRSQTLTERTERRSGRHGSLRECFWEPRAVDPRPGNATRSAQAAPRSDAACRRTACG